MRVAFVSDAVHPFNEGGKERRLWEISRWLARAGYHVDVYTMNWWRGPKTIEVDGVSFHAVCKFHPLYRGTHRSTLQAILFGVATLKLARERFDALDVDHIPYFPLLSARLVCLIRHKRLTATWHEVWGREYWVRYAGPAGHVGYLIERVTALMPDQIIANSEQTAERLRDMMRYAKPISVLPSGLDFEAIDAEAPSDTGVDVLYAGRLLDHKGVDILLRAVSVVSQYRPQVDCLVIGEGPERTNLERLSVELGIAANVRFCDFLPGNEIYGVMKSAGVFVLPSAREGYGLVVIEANACGLPVVTVRHQDNAATRLVQEGVNGFLAERNASDVARAILLTLLRRSTLDPRSTVDRARESLAWDNVASRVGRVLLCGSAEG